jgi:hypothetical protein
MVQWGADLYLSHETNELVLKNVSAAAISDQDFIF